MRTIIPLSVVLLCSAACAEPPAAAADTTSRSDASPYGSWTIVAVNGVPASPAGNGELEPSVTFTPTRYNGSTGCNGYGGIGVWLDGRWYGEWPMATQKACPTIGSQEQHILTLLAKGPRLEFQGSDGAILSTADGRLALRRAGSAAPDSSDPPPQLSGMTWRVAGVDGTPFSRDDRRLRFNAERWEFRDTCGTLEGRWSQKGQSVSMSLDAPTQDCRTGSLRPVFEALTASESRAATGPNGELVLAGGGRWIVGTAVPQG